MHAAASFAAALPPGPFSYLLETLLCLLPLLYFTAFGALVRRDSFLSVLTPLSLTIIFAAICVCHRPSRGPVWPRVLKRDLCFTSPLWPCCYLYLGEGDPLLYCLCADGGEAGSPPVSSVFLFMLLSVSLLRRGSLSVVCFRHLCWWWGGVPYFRCCSCRCAVVLARQPSALLSVSFSLFSPYCNCSGDSVFCLVVSLLVCRGSLSPPCSFVD